MKLVILESPYAGNIVQRWLNRRYARACVRDCLLRGESPSVSHLLFTQRGILRDEIPEERTLGIAAGLAWRRVAEKSVVYIDRGISNGMRIGIQTAVNANIPVEYRTILARPFYPDTTDARPVGASSVLSTRQAAASLNHSAAASSFEPEPEQQEPLHDLTAS